MCTPGYGRTQVDEHGYVFSHVDGLEYEALVMEEMWAKGRWLHTAFQSEPDEACLIIEGAEYVEGVREQ